MFLIFIIILILLEFFPIYKVINGPLSSHLQKNGKLILCTHNFEHKDVFIILREISYLTDRIYVVFADKIWNKLLEYFKSINSNFIFTEGGTTEKIIQKILQGYTIIMFLYNLDNPRTGLYYILRDTKCKLLLCRIKSEYKSKIHTEANILNIIYSNLNKTFTVEYDEINYKLGKNPKFFMENIKNYLV